MTTRALTEAAGAGDRDTAYAVSLGCTLMLATTDVKRAAQVADQLAAEHSLVFMWIAEPRHRGQRQRSRPYSQRWTL